MGMFYQLTLTDAEHMCNVTYRPMHSGFEDYVYFFHGHRIFYIEKIRNICYESQCYRQHCNFSILG